MSFVKIIKAKVKAISGKTIVCGNCGAICVTGIERCPQCNASLISMGVK